MTTRRSTAGWVLAGALLFLVGRAGEGRAGELVSAAEEVSPILVGTTVPDGALKTADGRETTLGELRGGEPSILVFYRGFW